MKHVLVLIAAFGPLAMVSCAPQQVQMAQTDNPVFSPRPLDDAWSNWLVGRWQGRGQSSAGGGISSMTIEKTLNGQFLMFTSEVAEIEMTPEQAQYLKNVTGASDEDIERFRRSGFREIRLQTIDPATREIAAYIFDSLRCVAVGRGRVKGNKEIVEWQWSVGGRGTSTSFLEKTDDDTFAMGGVYKQDGKVIEDKETITMTRQQD